MNKLIKIGEKYHLDLFFYIGISLFFVVYYWSIDVFKLIGLSFLVIGFLIWILGLISLKNNFSIKPAAKRLVTRGLYSKVRHPIYYGGFLSSMGLLLFTINTLWFWLFLAELLISLVVQIKRIRLEEKVLREKFSKEYELYRSKTWI